VLLKFSLEEVPILHSRITTELIVNIEIDAGEAVHLEATLVLNQQHFPPQ
jgi:hypothetical protein